MSADATEERPEGAPAGADASQHMGVLATYRQTPLAAKALLAGVFVSRLAGFLQIFLVLFLHEYRGFTEGQAGLALGMYGAGAILGTIAGGYLSDRLSARTATLISMGGSAFLLISILYLKIYVLVLVAIVLVAAVGLIFRPAAQAMLTELVPQNQLVMVTAMYRLCMNIGSTAAPLIGVALVSVSYNLLFWFEAAAAVVYGAIAWQNLPRRATPTAQHKKAAKDRGGYRAVLTDWRYDFYLAAVFLVMMVYIQMSAALPLAIRDAGLNLWWYGAVITLNAILVVALEVYVTKFVQTWPLRLTAIAGFGLIALGYGLYAIAIVPFILILGTLIWTATEIIGAPTTFAYPGLVAPPELRGRYFGVMQSTVGLGSTIGPIVGVWLWTQMHQGFWLVAAAVGILSAVCARIGMRIPDKTPTATPTPSPELTPEPAS